MAKFIRCFFIMFLFLTGSKASVAPEPVFVFFSSDSLEISRPEKPRFKDMDFNNPGHIQMLLEKTSHNKRITAFALAVFLGHFGVHRIYLGTEPVVPVFYVLTLGGGMGIIPLIDAIIILTTRDLGKFENNSRVIMWID